MHIVESYKLDSKGVKWLQENRADLYLIFSKALTVTEAKPAVEIKL